MDNLEIDMTIKLEVGKTYLTAGGYIIPIVKNEMSLFYTTLECSPGENKYSRKRGNGEDGWAWNRDESISGLSPEWIKKLTIVKELPFPLPKPPAGYQYKGGFPQLKKVEKGDTYLTSHSSDVNDLPSNRYGQENSGACEESFGFPSLRLMLERIPAQTKPTPPKIDDEWVAQDKVPYRPGIDEVNFKFKQGYEGAYITTDHNFGGRLHGSIDHRGDMLLIRCRKKDYPVTVSSAKPSPPQLPMDYEWTQNPPEFRVPRHNDHYIYRGEIVTALGADSAYSKPEWIVRPISVHEAPMKSEETYPKYYLPLGHTGNIAFARRDSKDKYTFVFSNGKVSNEMFEWEKSTEKAYALPITQEEAFARIKVQNKDKITNLCVELPPMKPLNIILPNAPKQSHLSYWIVEPLGNMFGAAKKSVRYFVVSSLIGAVGYTAYNPSGVAKFAKSCLPKINITINR